MARLTNTTRETISLIVKGDAKDGVPPTESLAPGETRDIDAVENASYRGHLAAGALLASTISPRPSRAAPAAENT